MSVKYILSIDQGTTGTTVSIIHSDGSCIAKTNEEYEQIFPKPGWVEHNPENIWLTVLSCIRKVLQQAGVSANQIAGIGITNQRETVVIWDKKSHKPIYNAIVWQCRRTTAFCESLKKKGLEKLIRKKTGLVIDPYFSGSKLRWLLNEVPDARKKARRGELAAGTIDSFLLWRLTDGEEHRTDVSNASRTQLMNIHQGHWDEELLKVFSVPENILPQISFSSGILGKTLNCPGLPNGIPIAGMAGDQQAALFGQACFEPGEAKCTYGTGSFLLMNTGKNAIKSQSGLLTTVAWKLGGDKELTYALEGGAFVCGAAVQWLRDEMQFIKESRDIETLAQKVESSEGVEFVPALTGLGAPYWDPRTRGIISGLTRGSGRAHLARATLDSMALQNVDILLAMEKDLKRKLKSLKVDGGASSNNFLMQLQADYLGSQLTRPLFVETTAMGAAFLAGLGIGFWTGLKDIKKILKVDKRFTPAISARDRKLRWASWHEAVARARYHK